MDTEEFFFKANDVLQGIIQDTEKRLKQDAWELKPRDRATYQQLKMQAIERITRLTEDFHVKPKAKEQISVTGSPAEIIAKEIIGTE